MSKPRVQDDLYTYVNQEKLDQLVIGLSEIEN